MRKILLIGAPLIALMTSVAANSENFADVINARQGQFYVLEYNLRVLEDMGNNRMPYERDIAVKRAENIQIVTRIHQDINWLPASVIDGIPGTRVRNLDGNRHPFQQHWMTMMKAADYMLEIAKDGPPMALGDAARKTRATCNLCHEYYRPAYGDVHGSKKK